MKQLSEGRSRKWSPHAVPAQDARSSRPGIVDMFALLQRRAGNAAVVSLVNASRATGATDIQTPQAIQRFIEINDYGHHKASLENGQPPKGFVPVFGAWRPFDGARWELDPDYGRWVVEGYRHDANAPGARSEPPPHQNYLALLQALMQQHLFQQQLLAQQQFAAQQQQLGQQQPNVVPPQSATAPPPTPAVPTLAVRPMKKKNAPVVLAEIKRWRQYVAAALAEGPTDQEVLFQLNSSATVLESVEHNLGEMVELDEDKHDFDIAVSSGGRLEGVVDSTAKSGALVIENLATNPQNLYTLQGTQGAVIRGVAKPLIAHIIQQAEATGRKYVRVIALTRAHVPRYERQGFRVDASKHEDGIPESEIHMIAKVAELKPRFGLQ